MILNGSKALSLCSLCQNHGKQLISVSTENVGAGDCALIVSMVGDFSRPELGEMP